MPDYREQDRRDPRDAKPAVPPMFRTPAAAVPRPQFQAALRPPPAPSRQPARCAPPQRYAPPARRSTGLTAAGQFWYILGNAWFGVMYFAKIPVRKALADAGLTEMTPAEKFWYVLMCIPMGAGYLAKIPAAKAVEEMQRQRR